MPYQWLISSGARKCRNWSSYTVWSRNTRRVPCSASDKGEKERPRVEGGDYRESKDLLREVSKRLCLQVLQYAKWPLQRTPRGALHIWCLISTTFCADLCISNVDIVRFPTVILLWYPSHYVSSRMLIALWRGTVELNVEINTITMFRVVSVHRTSCPRCFWRAHAHLQPPSVHAVPPEPT
jgi:hypothetical protein